MIIGGFQKFSLIDYPGKTCAIIFTRGCNFRCPYCHNPELVLPEQYAPAIPLTEIFAFLGKRRGTLDAVTITGGEPTLHSDLPEIIAQIKELGYCVKLDTNGSNPKMLSDILRCSLADYIAMDIKAPLDDYTRIIGRPMDASTIRQSIDLIIKSCVDHEFRTTVARSLTGPNDLKKIAHAIKGAKRYYIQKFRPGKINDMKFVDKHSFTGQQLQDIAREISGYVELCEVR